MPNATITAVIALAFAAVIAVDRRQTAFLATPPVATVENAKLAIARECLKVGVFRPWAVRTILTHRIDPTSMKSLVWRRTGGT
jgi:hypothetical protein